MVPRVFKCKENETEKNLQFWFVSNYNYINVSAIIICLQDDLKMY